MQNKTVPNLLESIFVSLCLGLCALTPSASAAQASSFGRHVPGNLTKSNASSTPPGTLAPVNWTPLLLRNEPSTQVFKATDGRYHIAYETILTNFGPNQITIKSIDCVEAQHPEKILKSFTPHDLQTSLNPPSVDGKFAGLSLAVLFVNIDFDRLEDVPRAIKNEVTFDAKDQDGKPATYSYEAGMVFLDQAKPIVLGPPFKGGSWLALGGFSSPLGHRRAIFPIDNRIINAQRYAIDWIKLDQSNRSSTGDRTEEEVCYGQPVLAVRDATVAATIDRFADQKPIKPEGSERIAYPGGNSVILDLGGDLYAFYAHLKPGSILVKPGERVTRGQKIAEVGNSGNTTGAHLHLHILTGPSMLSAPGVPYSFEQFTMTGRVADMTTCEADDAAHKPLHIEKSELNGKHEKELPKDGDVIEFPE